MDSLERIGLVLFLQDGGLVQFVERNRIEVESITMPYALVDHILQIILLMAIGKPW